MGGATEVTNDIIVNPPAAVRAVEDLVALAAEINAEHQAGEEATRRGLEHYHRAGLKLLEAKQRCGHGHWLKWVSDNLRFTERQARRYMELARSDVTSDLWATWQRISGNAPTAAGPDADGNPAGSSAFVAEETQADDDTNWVDKECNSVEWYTPPAVLERVRDYFGGPIPLDPATAPHNPTGALRFFTAEQDGLRQDWSRDGAFVNPPYGAAMRDWCRKLHEEADRGVPVIALLPCGARFSTAYWQEHVLNGRLTAICFVQGRVAFVSPQGEAPAGNPYDSAVYGFNADRERFARAFGPLGRIVPVGGGPAAVQPGDACQSPPGPAGESAPPGLIALPHVAQNSGEQEWYTPPEYLDAGRRVLGAFDLDPATSDIAQRSVRAARYHTKDDDGLSFPWAGRVWLNPPYARGLVDRFVAKLVGHYEAGDVTAAVALVNNATETRWCRQCLDAAAAACYPTGRVEFLRPDGTASDNGALQGQLVFYLGGDVAGFRAAFERFGPVWRPCR
jgi:phage N-6-adenine-methyltransferase